MIRLEIKNYNMMLTGKQQKYWKYQNIVSSKYYKQQKYLSGGEILLSNQRQVIELAKFTYSPLGKAFEKQIKNNGRAKKKNKQMLLGIKMIIKVIIKKYLKNQLKNQ